MTMERELAYYDQKVRNYIDTEACKQKLANDELRQMIDVLHSRIDSLESQVAGL